MKHFWGSLLVTIVGLAIAFFFSGRSENGFILQAGLNALFICSVLAVMEVSLSFDNAVVNAKVLKGMNAFWRKMFLTVGMIIAVFGMRLLLPIGIVAVASGMGYWETTQLALNNPTEYGHKLHDCESSIAAFGGVFLLMVFLNFLFDNQRETHWIGPIERRLAKVGKLDTAAAVSALCALLLFAHYLPHDKQIAALIAGVLGVICYLLLDGVKALTSDDSGEPSAGGQAAAGAAKSGLAAFCYLEVLDASFSLDGVVGAFALSKSVLIIMVGLAIGAMFVRSMTIYLVEKGTLDEFCFLEHGAHWAIGALAVMMLLGALPGFHIPEWITGLTGAILIGLSLGSSILERRKSPAE